MAKFAELLKYSPTTDRGRLLYSLIVLAAACGPKVGPSGPASDSLSAPSRVEAHGAMESQVLQVLDRLVDGAPTRVGSSVVSAAPAYLAASGRRCRALTLVSGSPQHNWAVGSSRVACRETGPWFFVPTVFDSSTIATEGSMPPPARRPQEFAPAEAATSGLP